MADFIAYYRVSTDRQGASGLGLDAQRQAVAGFIGTGQLVAEFTEIESGRRHTNRPQLLAALTECRKRRAVLLIARLDRLARNVAFIANLMESGVDFVAVDMPSASRLTIHILAAVAEHEREMISTRTESRACRSKTQRHDAWQSSHRGGPLARPGRSPRPQTRAGSVHAHDRMESTRQGLARDCPRSEPAQHPPPARPSVVRQQREESADDGVIRSFIIRQPGPSPAVVCG